VKGPVIALVLLGVAVLGLLVFWFVKTRQQEIIVPSQPTPSITGGVAGLMGAGVTSINTSTSAIIKVLTTPVDAVRKIFHL
jgi:hypothetical protein